jgi:20S proteasome alpha/beta subunit
MTLIVSLRTPDGIVLAGDSLATMMGNVQIGADLAVICPECGHNHTSQHTIDLPPAPATSLSYAQKIFPFLDDYAMGTFGAGILMGKTIHFAIRELERVVRDKTEDKRPKSVKEVAEVAGKHIHKLLRDQLKAENKDLATMPENVAPLGLHVVGYEDGTAKTLVANIGREVKITEQKGAGVTASGETVVLQAMGAVYTQHEQTKPVYDIFSLQDAIEYAEFAISTTASFQHFSRSMPTVGGDVDIILVTPFDHYRWIKQKSLESRLSGGRRL